MKGAFASAAISMILGGCSSYGGLDQQDSRIAVVSDLPPPDPRVLASRQSGYRLGSFDEIIVRVYGAQDLETRATLDSAGAFTMPLIGRVEMGGMSISEGSALIADRLRGRYVRDPQVNIQLEEARSQTITIDGAVTVPGVYPVTRDLTLQSAIATARGATEFAALNKIVVFRTIGGEQNAAQFSLKDIREGRYPDPRVYPDDYIVVGESGTRRLLRDIGQIAPIFGVFTPVVYNNN